MRTCVRPIVLALLLLPVAPGRADAHWFDFVDWLDNLSGPGPFTGIGGGVYVRCQTSDGHWFWCWDSDPQNQGWRRVEIAPVASYMWGKANEQLQYPAGTDGLRGVDVVTVGGQVIYRFQKKVGVMARGAAYHFKGPLVRNGEGLTRPVFGVGPVWTPVFRNRFRVDLVAPFIQTGLGQFETSDFGLAEDAPPLSSDRVKVAFNVIVGF